MKHGNFVHEALRPELP